MPAALGAAADVPPCRSEQLFSPTSVVCYCLFVYQSAHQNGIDIALTINWPPPLE